MTTAKSQLASDLEEVYNEEFMETESFEGEFSEAAGEASTLEQVPSNFLYAADAADHPMDEVDVSSSEKSTAIALDAYFGSFDDVKPRKAAANEQEVIILPKDDRVRINPTTSYPWRAICSLRIRTKTGKTYIGTGWFISPRTVMTAGHCVYLHNEGGWAQSIEVIPARNGGSRPYGSCSSSSLRSVTGWTSGKKRDYDYGCIILPSNCRLGQTTGYFGFSAKNDSFLTSNVLNLSGYPGDKGGDEQWFHAKKAKSVTGRTIVYDIDTMGGQSGSPVWYLSGSARYAVGVHTNGHSSGNSATRIITEVFNLMKTWKALGA